MKNGYNAILLLASGIILLIYTAYAGLTTLI